jgi:hypothetical protein
MRRLTLILSDLYLPAHAVRESFPTTLAMPALQWLLRFADRRRIADWRAWLARELGAAAIAEWPVAHLCAHALGQPADGSWLATPVALEARLDHVRLRDRGLLQVPQEQQRALQVEFAALFGDAMALQATGHSSLLLRGGPRADIVTHDPARLLDSDIGHALPTGSDAAGELRRLGAEIEMWLHSSAVNVAREKAGQRRITTLWLWGGGSTRPALPDHVFGKGDFRLEGSDCFIKAVQALAGGAIARAVPAAFEVAAKGSTCVEVSPMSGSPTESLGDLERHWFEPARRALTSGELDALRLVANDQVFEIGARAGWKFWRPRRNWLESLA